MKRVSQGSEWIMTSLSGSLRDLCEKEFLIKSPIAIKSERYRVEWKPSFYSTENSGSTARVEGNIFFFLVRLKF